MTRRLNRTFAAFVWGTALLVGATLARGQANTPESPYGGTTVEDIIARVNSQIITMSDYNRALNDLDQDSRQRGLSMQQMSVARKDLLRNLIDQQLWLSKGKELGLTGETELIKRLDEIRKQSNLETLEDLEKAAKEQGVSFEDFKANIRNQIITQSVMRQEVGAHILMTPGEVERYYEQHKQEYTQPESVQLSEIRVSLPQEGADDAAKQAAAKAKIDDIAARLHAGGDFAQLARTFSDGTTAASGGELGVYKRGQLSKLLEDKTFVLQAGQYTEPILTRQGYIILKVVQHASGGSRPYKDVESQVEEAFYLSRMEPAIREYLNRMRDEAFIQIKSGYTDSGATPAELNSSISFSAYVPPSPKKKAKVERTRFRENTRTFRQKTAAVVPAVEHQQAPAATPVTQESKKKVKAAEPVTEKPGRREKIRYGQAPRATLPGATRNTATEDAGALPPGEASADQPANPLEPTAPDRKTRFSTRARVPRKVQPGINPGEAMTPAAPDAAEVADQQTQAAPLGISGSSTNTKKKKAAIATAEKTRLSDKKKEPSESQPQPVQQPTLIPAVKGAPAPSNQSTAPDAPAEPQS
jgi:peptidyl-prolyl cis-trans isomerase SurA